MIYYICVDCWDKVTHVAESYSEINPFFSSSMIIYAFWGLIGLWYFQVFSIDWARSYCRKIAINDLNIDFRMLWCVLLCAIPEL